MGNYVSEESQADVGLDDITKFDFPIRKEYIDLSKEKNFEHLPPNVVHELFLFLRPQDLVRVFSTCQYFSKVGTSHIFWRDYYHAYFNLRRLKRKEGNCDTGELNYRKQFFKRFVDSKMKDGAGNLYNQRKRCLKICVCGDRGVGKSTIIGRYCPSFNTFSPNGNMMVMSSFSYEEDKSVPVQIWECDDRHSFHEYGKIEEWKRDYYELLKFEEEEIPMMLVGNCKKKKEEDGMIIREVEVKEKFPDDVYFRMTGDPEEDESVIKEAFEFGMKLVVERKKEVIREWETLPLLPVEAGDPNNASCSIM